MFGVDVGTIPCGFGASTNAQGLHLLCPSESGFQLTSQILVNKCGSNGMMTDPYPHPQPQHMKVVNHLLYMYGVDVGTIPCGFGASTKAQGLHLLCPSESGFQLLLPKS